MSPAILCASETGVWGQELPEQEAMKFFVVHSHTQQSWVALSINVVTSETVHLHMQKPSVIYHLNTDRPWLRQQK